MQYYGHVTLVLQSCPPMVETESLPLIFRRVRASWRGQFTAPYLQTAGTIGPGFKKCRTGKLSPALPGEGAFRLLEYPCVPG